MLSNNLLRGVTFAGLLVLLTTSMCPTGRAQTANEVPSDYQTLQELAVRFFAAGRGLNWEVLRALSLSGKLEKLPASRERLEKWGNRELYDLSSPAFSRFKQDGAQASLRMRVTLNLRDWKTNQLTPGPESFNLAFVRRDGEWKVSYFDTAARDFLSAFMAARSADEERRILELEQELLYSEEITSVFNYFSRLDHNADQAKLDRLLKAIEGNKNNPLGVAFALWWDGKMSFDRGDYRASESAFLRAVRIAEEIRVSWLLAPSCTHLAQTYVKLRDDGQAQKFQQQGLAIFLTDPKHYEDALIHQRMFANAYFNDQSYEKARDHYQKGLALAAEAKAKEWEAIFDKDIGDTHYMRDDHAQALSWYQRTLDLFSSLPKSPVKLKDTLSIWQVHLSVGAAFQKQKNTSRALDSFRHAREAAAAAKDAAGIDLSFRATGDYYLSINDVAAGLGFYTQMTDRLDEIGSLAGCDCIAAVVANLVCKGTDAGPVEAFLVTILSKYEARLPANEALKLRGLKGALYLYRGENAKAENELKALLGHDGLDDELRAKVSLLLSAVYAAQGQVDEAWKYTIQAGSLERGLNDEELVSVIKSQKALLMASFLENEAQSIKSLQELVAQTTDKSVLSITHAYLSILYMAGGQNEKALASAKASLEYLDRQDAFQAYLSSVSMLNMAFINSQSGQPQAALQAAQQAVVIARRLRLNLILRQARAVEGLSYYKLRRLPEARAALAEAVSMVEERRNQQAGGIEGALSYFDSMITPYETMLDVLYEMKDYGAAVQFIESAKARMLLDMLSEGSAESPAGPPVLDSAQVRSLLPDDKTALLQYAVTDEHVYLFLLAGVNSARVSKLGAAEQGPRDGAPWRVYRLNVSKDALTDAVDKLREVLSGNRSGYSTHCRDLYSILLEPAARDLAGKTSLIIIPDGILWGIPFQALQPSENHFLLEDFTVSYAPSMAVLSKMLQPRRARRAEQGVRTPRILALANPAGDVQNIEISPVIANVFGASDASGPQPWTFDRARIRRYATLQPLPGAMDEVGRLAAIYGPGEVTLLSGASLTKDDFKRVAGRYRILHIATHGILDFQSPLNSAVVIGRPTPAPQDQNYVYAEPSPTPPSDEHLLSAREVMGMRLRADLVVLSACDTAGGGLSEGEGVIGLTWAFAAAGVPAIVASQWAVGDRTTALLMQDFHRRLQSYRQKDGSVRSTAAALSEAEREMARDREHRHPYYWAAFVVVGNGQ
jgi:CHAT domain-containing protein/tetratricopeptide (TPR) repeat protein